MSLPALFRTALLAILLITFGAGRSWASSPNAFSVLAAREGERSRLIEAQSKWLQAVSQSWVLRMDALLKWFDAQDKLLDLKRKRAYLFYELRDLRNARRATEIAEQRERNLADRDQRRSETASPVRVWPSLFDHPTLRDQAGNLLQVLAARTESNSGVLSANYSQSQRHIGELKRQLLRTPISHEQRTAAAKFLRQLDHQLRQPHRDGDSLAKIVEAELRRRTDDRDPFHRLTAQIDAAERVGDLARLRQLAETIRQATTLTSGQRRELNEQGRMAYAAAKQRLTVLVHRR